MEKILDEIYPPKFQSPGSAKKDYPKMFTGPGPPGAALRAKNRAFTEEKKPRAAFPIPIKAHLRGFQAEAALFAVDSWCTPNRSKAYSRTNPSRSVSR